MAAKSDQPINQAHDETTTRGRPSVLPDAIQASLVHDAACGKNQIPGRSLFGYTGH